MYLIMRAAADVIGFKGVIGLKEDKDDVDADAMQITIQGHSSRAEQFLGWQPKRRGMKAGMDIYTTA